MMPLQDKPIEIEHGIPIPEAKHKRSAVYVAVQKLRVGDSFLTPAGTPLATPYTVAQRLGVKISSRKVDDNCIRIWRIK
jgi:hypothetical protein